MADDDRETELTREETEFLQELRVRRVRHEKDVRERDESFWSTVGMMGTVGWSVAMPTALGVLLGRWAG